MTHLEVSWLPYLWLATFALIRSYFPAGSSCTAEGWPGTRSLRIGRAPDLVLVSLPPYYFKSSSRSALDGGRLRIGAAAGAAEINISDRLPGGLFSANTGLPLVCVQNEEVCV